ncbi:hypothetical protein IEQ34_006474 [Dendrobium chrysotoxum]|uniref:Uncharacterized protein n=1 Tax=Dendrobium chrysotoxum TaxID=161865 RepID=A0AAV7HCP2_DENCH|nr:hypothetical protein IEQ34_006474 [Dendrobium chrysotoxum]
MEKGIGQGLQRKSMKRRKSKGFAKALAQYLVSDSYMYAPLINSPLSKPPVLPPEYPFSTVEEAAWDASARSSATPASWHPTTVLIISYLTT